MIRDLRDGTVRELAPGFDRSPDSLLWSADSRTLYALAEECGRRSEHLDALEELADLADELMAQRAAERLGETIDVLIEEPADEGRYGGRAAHQAPEVDGATEVLSSGPLAAGDIVRAVVIGAEGADLAAEATGGLPADGGRPMWPGTGAGRIESA